MKGDLYAWSGRTSILFACPADKKGTEEISDDYSNRCAPMFMDVA